MGWCSVGDMSRTEGLIGMGSVLEQIDRTAAKLGKRSRVWGFVKSKADKERLTELESKLKDAIQTFQVSSTVMPRHSS